MLLLQAHFQQKVLGIDYFQNHLDHLLTQKKNSLKRFGEHQELANLAAYLVSDYSDYMTGEVVTIDGGEWIYNAGEFSWLDKVPKNYGAY